MANFSTGLSSSSVNWDGAVGVLENLLPVKVASGDWTTTQDHNTSTREVLATASLVGIESGDVVVAVCTFSVGSDNTANDTWLFDIQLAGTGGIAYPWDATKTSTDGKEDVVTVVNVFTSPTTGNQDVTFGWASETNPPTGTVYSRRGNLWAFCLKQRANS